MKRTFNFSVMIKPAVDLVDHWIGHCLELDVVTVGTTLQHTFEMIAEAIALVVIDDLKNNFNTSDRRAPEEFWNEWYRIVEGGQKLGTADILKEINNTKKITALAVMMSLHVEAENQLKSKSANVAQPDASAGHQRQPKKKHQEIGNISPNWTLPVGGWSGLAPAHA